jgi:hypothetical protein
MSFEELNEFQDQAKRPDLRFWTALSLMIVGLGLSYFTSAPNSIAIDSKRDTIPQTETNDIKTILRNDPQFIKTLNADQVSDLFGTPDFLRGEGDFLMWQYKSNSCVLEIYWKETNGQKSFPRHIILRDIIKTESDCIQSLY